MNRISIKYIIPTLVFSSLALGLAVSCRTTPSLPAASAVAADTGIAIIPAPQKLERRAGVFHLDTTTRIAADPASLQTAQWLAERLRRATGYAIPVAAKGKAAAGEILLTTQKAAAALGPEGYALTVAPRPVVMDWTGGAEEGAREGHDVVMSPTGYCYFDYYQSTNQSAEPRAIGGFLPLSKVYSFEPVPEKLPAPFQQHILGLQGNLWTEYIPLGQRVEAFALDQWQGGEWVEFATGTSIGHCCLVRHDPVTTGKLCLRLLKSPVASALSEFGVFSEPP